MFPGKHKRAQVGVKLRSSWGLPLASWLLASQAPAAPVLALLFPRFPWPTKAAALGLELGALGLFQPGQALT